MTAAASPPAGPDVHPLVTGLGVAVAAAALAGLGEAGRAGLAVGCFALQCAAVLGWVVALRVPAPYGVAAVALGAGLGADVVGATVDRVTVGGYAGVVAVAFLAGVLHQLVRRGRTRVTESLAATLALAVVAVGAATLVPLLAGRGGAAAVATALVGVVVAVPSARLVDLVRPAPALVPGGRRGLPGSVTGLVVAAVAGAAGGGLADRLSAGEGLAVALVAAAVALTADVGVELGRVQGADAAAAGGGGEAPPDAHGRGDRWAWAALAVALPVLLAAVPAYVVARVALS